MVPFVYCAILSFSVPSPELLDSDITINGNRFGSWDACFCLFGLLSVGRRPATDAPVAVVFALYYTLFLLLFIPFPR